HGAAEGDRHARGGQTGGRAGGGRGRDEGRCDTRGPLAVRRGDAGRHRQGRAAGAAGVSKRPSYFWYGFTSPEREPTRYTEEKRMPRSTKGEPAHADGQDSDSGTSRQGEIGRRVGS